MEEKLEKSRQTTQKEKIIAAGLFVIIATAITWMAADAYKKSQVWELERYNVKLNTFVKYVKMDRNKEDLYPIILGYDTNFFIKVIKKNKKQNELNIFLKDDKLTTKEFNILFDEAIVENKEYFKQRNKKNKENVKALIK